jgi:hypothetical protein
VREVRIDCAFEVAHDIGSAFVVDHTLFEAPLRHQAQGVRLELSFVDEVMMTPPDAPARWPRTVRGVAYVEVAEDDDPSAKATAAFLATEDAAIRLVDMVRAAQPWSGLIGQPFERRAVTARWTDSLDTVSLGNTRRASRPLIVSDTGLALEDAQAAVSGNGPELPERFLSEAHWYSRFSNPRRPEQAIVLAAAACEVSAKRTLMASAPAQAQPLLRHLFEDSRNYAVSAAELFRRVPETTLGRSLADDDKETWKSLDRLFQRRNKVVHLAHRYTEEEATEGALAASKAIRWMRAVTAGESESP